MDSNPWGTLPRPTMWPDLVAGVLSLGKVLAGSKFPAIPEDPQQRLVFVDEWGRAMRDINAPWDMWPDAVRWWCATAGDDQRWTVAQARRAIRHMHEVWELDPRGREILEQRRIARLRDKEARGALPVGSAPETPADGAQAAITGSTEEERGAGRRRADEFRAELKRRRQEREAARRAQLTQNIEQDQE